MTLEAVMICIDNSEYSRNGDYVPSRLDAQTDAANVVCGAKAQQHPENVVGVAFMCGDRVDVRLSPSNDIGHVLSVLSGVPVLGEGCDLVRAIQTCSLALKHRQNKNQKQRLVCFVASPLVCSEKQMEQVGKVLKKNNVAIDVVSLGDVDGANRAKLKKLVDSADSAGSSHFVELGPNSGQHLADVIISSPILQGDRVDGGGDEEGGGFDANMDPELAMAIRLSMEEERQRQGGAATTSEPVNTAEASGSSQVDDFDAELRAALLASMGENTPTPPAPQVEMDEDEDELVRKALAESMEDWEGETDPKKAKMDTEDDSKEIDSNLVSELLATLPGVDVNDPRIQEALRAAANQRNNSSSSKKE